MRVGFENKRVLVTGGTRGIGHQVASDMASLGAEVVITGTSTAPQNLHKKMRFIAVDFLNEVETGNFIKYLEAQEFDICINNAGINRIDPLKKQDCQHILYLGHH